MTGDGGPDPEGGPARLVVLAGPTAVGKGTVAADVRERYPQVWLSVSATTRAPRPGEVDGVHYRFTSEAAFDALVASGQMLEWAVVHGRHRYGTPREPVERALAAGAPVLLEIDLQGARQVREACRAPSARALAAARFVFLAPPSWAELERRLVGRGTEGPAERARRLSTARVELAAEGEFDAVVVNDDVVRAADELVSFLGLGPRTPAAR